METYKAILTRRSIRKFRYAPIKTSTLEKLLKAGMYAPSARNTQSWQFVVITSRKILKDIPKVHPYSKMCRTAGAAIIVCADLRIESSLKYNSLNCANASMNILLAAHEMGLGSVWMGVYPRPARIKDVTKLLNLPSNIVPISIIALGKPDEKKEIPDRFNKDRIHINKW